MIYKRFPRLPNGTILRRHRIQTELAEWADRHAKSASPAGYWSCGQVQWLEQSAEGGGMRAPICPCARLIPRTTLGTRRSRPGRCPGRR